MMDYGKIWLEQKYGVYFTSVYEHVEGYYFGSQIDHKWYFSWSVKCLIGYTLSLSNL